MCAKEVRHIFVSEVVCDCAPQLSDLQHTHASPAHTHTRSPGLFSYHCGPLHVFLTLNVTSTLPSTETQVLTMKFNNKVQRPKKISCKIMAGPHSAR